MEGGRKVTMRCGMDCPCSSATWTIETRKLFEQAFGEPCGIGWINHARGTNAEHNQKSTYTAGFAIIHHVKAATHRHRDKIQTLFE